MPPIRAIVFDAGGTLIHPARPVGEIYARFASRYGVELPAEATTAAFRLAFKSCSPRGRNAVPRNGDDRVWWKEVVRQSLTKTAFQQESAFETFFEEVYLYYAKPEAWNLYPEVGEVLEALRKTTFQLSVLSNWDARLHPVLDGHGLGGMLSRRFISAELGWEKPDPAIYRHVAESLEVASESILSVGDDMVNDVTGPQEAGWRALHINRPEGNLRALYERAEIRNPTVPD